MGYSSGRIALTVTMICGLFVAIGWLFWRQEIQYLLPTPVPVGYRATPIGTEIDVHQLLGKGDAGKTWLVHFFNPECPCSRFNLPHFEALAKEKGNALNVRIVVPTEHYEHSELEAFAQKYQINFSVVFDPMGHVAKSFGVYASPQAVILDEVGKLYFRGNYNRTRYCTDLATQYAAQALEACLSGAPAPSFDQQATTAYGCELPNTQKWEL